MYKFAILGLLIFSFGFSSAFADDTFVNPDEISFDQVPEWKLPKHVPQIIDPLTGQEPVIDKTKHYTAYSVEIGSSIDSNEKQLVSIDGQQFYLVPDSLDRTANILAVILLGVPFGIIVYRLSDYDEVNTHGTNPLVADTDGLSDGAEVNTHGTNPVVADTDSGGVNDGDEIINGLNPLKRNDDRLLLWLILDLI